MKAVGFDLDGTLIDSTDAIVASFFHTYRELGENPPPRETIIATISHTLEEQFRMLSKFDPAHAARVYREHYVRTAPSTTLLLPGAAEGLSTLARKGIRMGVATSKKRTSAEPILDYLGISSFFEACIGPEDVTHHKPHPEPLHALSRRLNLAGPVELVYIGDTPFDAKAAHAAGAGFIGVTTGYASRRELEACGARRIVDSIAEAVNCVLTDCIRTS